MAKKVKVHYKTEFGQDVVLFPATLAEQVMVRTENGEYIPLSDYLENIDESLGRDIIYREELLVDLNADVKNLQVAGAQAIKDYISVLLNPLLTRLQRLEDMFAGGVSTNEFMVTFADLNDVKMVKGIYNSALQRVEC